MTYWDELDALAASANPPKQGKLSLRRGEGVKLPKTQITPEEWAMVGKLKSVTYPVGSGAKRFIRDLNEKAMLTDRGRNFLAYIAHRYRRQWKASAEDSQWVEKWKWSKP